MAREGAPISGRTATVLLLALALAVSLPVLMQPNESADLLAVWLAADAFADGAPLYPDPSGAFTMRPPEGWTDRAAAAGYEGAVFPYLYPPLWAALLAKTGLSFAALKTIAAILNPLLLLSISALTWRAMRPSMGVLPFVCIGQILLYGTLIGVVAVHSDQPQILVAFLMVLAVERDARGAPFAAGAALAAAAAIKLFPALFVVVWLATGNRRALLGFVLVGGALGLASLAVAGWPAHAQMLLVVSQISHSLMSIPLSLGLDAALVEVMQPADTVLVPGLVTEGTAHPPPVTQVALKSPLWLWLGRLAYVAILVWAALAARRMDPEARARHLWPVFLAAVPMVGPLAWAYYYIPLFAAAPWLVDRFGLRPGALLLLAIAVPVSLPAFDILYALQIPFQAVGAVTVLVLMALFALPPREPAADGRRSPLRPGRASL